MGVIPAAFVAGALLLVALVIAALTEGNREEWTR